MGLVDLRKQWKRRSPAQLAKHLKGFKLDLKFSAGVWFFAPGGGRFHDRYTEPMGLEEKFEIAARLKKYGPCGLEAHYPNEVNEENIDQYVKFGRQTGVRLISIVPNLFFDSQFEFGALSSPIRKVRRAAIERTKTTLKLNKRIGTDFSIVWPGIDGYDSRPERISSTRGSTAMRTRSAWTSSPPATASATGLPRRWKPSRASASPKSPSRTSPADTSFTARHLKAC